MASINFNNSYNLNLLNLKSNAKTQKEENVQDAQQMNVISTSKGVAANEVLNVLANSAATSGININRDMQYQTKLDNAKNAYAQAKEELAQNNDPSKMDALMKAVDNAFNAYQKVLSELVDAGFLKRTSETIETRAGGRVEIDEIFDEEGNIVNRTEVKYDENGKVVEKRVTTYEYKNGSLDSTVTWVYDGNDKRIQEIAEYNTGDKGVTDYIYNEDGKNLGYVKKNYDADGYLESKFEVGCDENGSKLIGQNGEEIHNRHTYYDSEGNIKNGARYGDSDTIYAISEYLYEPHCSRYYDENGNLVREANYEENTVTLFKYDENGRIVSEKTLQDKVLKEVKYEYGDNGEVIKTTTEPREDGGKVVTIEEKDSNGNVVRTTTENYRANGTLESRDIVEVSPTIGRPNSKKALLSNITIEKKDDNTPKLTWKPTRLS